MMLIDGLIIECLKNVYQNYLTPSAKLITGRNNKIKKILMYTYEDHHVSILLILS